MLSQTMKEYREGLAACSTTTKHLSWNLLVLYPSSIMWQLTTTQLNCLF